MATLKQFNKVLHFYDTLLADWRHWGYEDIKPLWSILYPLYVSHGNQEINVYYYGGTDIYLGRHDDTTKILRMSDYPDDLTEQELFERVVSDIKKCITIKRNKHLRDWTEDGPQYEYYKYQFDDHGNIIRDDQGRPIYAYDPITPESE